MNQRSVLIGIGVFYALLKDDFIVLMSVITGYVIHMLLASRYLAVA